MASIKSLYRAARKQYLAKVRNLERQGYKVERIKIVKNPTRQSIQRLKQQTTRKIRREAKRKAGLIPTSEEINRRARQRRKSKKKSPPDELDILKERVYEYIADSPYLGTRNFILNHLQMIESQDKTQLYAVLRTALESDAFAMVLRYNYEEAFGRKMVLSYFYQFLSEVGYIREDDVPDNVLSELVYMNTVENDFGEPNEEEETQFYATRKKR